MAIGKHQEIILRDTLPVDIFTKLNSQISSKKYLPFF